MKVKTSGGKASAARRMVLELLMADHAPCKANFMPEGCELEKWAAKVGVAEARFPSSVRPRSEDASNSAIIFNAEACINCYRCVRACDDVQVNEVIGIAGRGFGAEIVFDYSDPMGDSGCVTCGECVQRCPTGALVEKRVASLPQPVGQDALTTVESICPYCGVGCAILYDVLDNRVVRADGLEDGPANHGRLCVKGRFGWDYTEHRERLKRPLIRRNGVSRGPLGTRRIEDVFREATWDEAMKAVADGLSRLKREHGSGSLAGFSSAKCTNEENYIFQKWVRACLGTPHIDHCTRLCHSSSVYALQTAIGTGSMTNAIYDIKEADVIIVTGSNTTDNHPVIANLIKQAARGKTTLIVVDPRRIELARFARFHLQQNPGTDVALYLGMMKIIIDEGLVDTGFVLSNTEGYDELVEAAKPYDAERVEKITGVPRALLREAALAYGQAERAAVYWGMGISQHTTGSDNSFCLINLQLLTGNIGREGTGLNPLRGQNNVQGASDMGAIPMYYPGYQSADDPRVREKFAAAWNVPTAPARGMTVTEIVKAAASDVPADRRVRGLYIMGENPILSDPDMNHVDDCIRSLDFLAVQDIFMTETAEYADVILPAATGLEKEGTYANTDRHVQLGRAVVKPPGEARQDWMIIQDISNLMGYEMRYASPQEIHDEMRRLVPDYAGITYERIEAGPIQWPARDETKPGMRIYETMPRGKGLFKAVEFLPAKELPDAGFPFVLNTGRVLEHWHTGTMTRRAAVLDDISPDAFVEMHEEDAELTGIRDGETVKVSSRRGDVTLRSKVGRRVPKKTVFIPFHFKEAAANLLTIDALDPYAKIPEFKFCAVRVERAGPNTVGSRRS